MKRISYLTILSVFLVGSSCYASDSSTITHSSIVLGDYEAFRQIVIKTRYAGEFPSPEKYMEAKGVLTSFADSMYREYPLNNQGEDMKELCLTARFDNILGRLVAILGGGEKGIKNFNMIFGKSAIIIVLRENTRNVLSNAKKGKYNGLLSKLQEEDMLNNPTDCFPNCIFNNGDYHQ